MQYYDCDILYIFFILLNCSLLPLFSILRLLKGRVYQQKKINILTRQLYFQKLTRLYINQFNTKKLIANKSAIRNNFWKLRANGEY